MVGAHLEELRAATWAAREANMRDVMAANMDLDAPIEELRGAGTLRDKPKSLKAERVAARDDEPGQKELFYTEGTLALKEARVWLCRYSTERAAGRLERERQPLDPALGRHPAARHPATRLCARAAGP